MGYGDIGQEVGSLARAFKMNTIALRRRKQLSEQEQDHGLKVQLLIPSTCQSSEDLGLPLALPLPLV